MAEAITGQRKYYRTGNSGLNSSVALDYAGNVPYGYTEISRDDYIRDLEIQLRVAQDFSKNYTKRKNTYYNNITGEAHIGQNYGDNEINDLQTRLYDVQSNQPYDSGYRNDPTTGAVTTQQNIELSESNRRGVEEGRLIEIAPGRFVPKDSAALQGNIPADKVPFQAQNMQSQQSSYTGGSIVDYLASTGQSSDFTSRSALAKQKGIQNYTGTAEQNTQLLNMLRSNAPAVPNASSVPSSAQQISQTGSFQFPGMSPGTPDNTGVGGMLAYYQNYFATQDQIAKDTLSQIENQQKLQASQTKPFLDKLLSGRSPEQARTDAFRQAGIDPTQYFQEQKAKLAEIEKLNEEYNAIVAAKDAQLASAQDRLGSTNFINNTVAQIERNAAPKLNNLAGNIKSKAAILEAQQGRFQEATRFAEQAVQDATAELKFNYDLFRTFYDMNQDVINNLKGEYKDAMKSGLSAAEKAFQLQYEEKTNVAKLMVSNPNANISINDSIFDAYQKVKSSGGGSSGGTFTNTQLNKGASNAGLPLNDFKNLSSDIKNFFINTPPTSLKQFQSIISDVNSGKEDASKVTKEIDESNLTSAVKEYLKSKIDVSSTDTSGWWDKIKNFFGFNG